MTGGLFDHHPPPVNFTQGPRRAVVVRVNSPEWRAAAAEGRAVYVGWAMPRRGFKASPFGNPFKVGPARTREQAIRDYRRWLMAQPELVERARRELAGKVLGCWCKPDACHGDVLAELVTG